MAGHAFALVTAKEIYLVHENILGIRLIATRRFSRARRASMASNTTLSFDFKS